MIIRRYVDVKNQGQASRLVSEGYIPLISKIPGLVSFHLMDCGGGVMVSVGVFETMHAADQASLIAAAFVRTNLAPLLHGAPEVFSGAVVCHRHSHAPIMN